MAVNRITLAQFHNVESSKNSKKSATTPSNVVQLSAQSPHLLENYLNLVGNQNRSMISFGAKQRVPENPKQFVTHPSIESSLISPFDSKFMVEAFRPGISNYAKWKIEEEATNRIYGKKPWPKIDNINAWMVTAETNKFMSVGGLAKVAADLPNRFNARFENDPKNKMKNITPMYKYKDDYKIVDKDGKKFYKYGVKFDEAQQKNVDKLIEIIPIGKVNVPIYNPSINTKLQDTEVDIYKAYTDYTEENGAIKNDGTTYYFLDTPVKRIDENGKEVDNAQIFNVEDVNPSSANNKTPYAKNTSGTDEVTRMAFFSKAVYEMMKNAKEGKLKSIEAPNSLLLNDWHAGSLAAMIRYTSNAEADSARISKETGEYFDQIPAIYIAHNIEHQGSTNHDDNRRTSVFATLFGEYGVDILQNAKSWRSGDSQFDPKDDDKVAMMKGSDFNSAVTGMMLVDRVVPVSENYAEELIHSNIKANGLTDLMNARAFSPFAKTLTPITNGYTKALIAPTENHMKDILKQAKKDFTLNHKLSIKLDDINFKPFDDGNIENKKHNKNEVMKILKRTIEREKDLMANHNDYSQRKYLLHDPFNTELPDIENFEDVPVIACVGRTDPQKGLDTILKEAIWQFAKHNANKPANELPIFVIGGTISSNEVYDKLKQMKDELRTQDNGAYANLAKRIILVKDYVNTNMLATAADMFLVPSVFEPCGLTQMEAMAKGALPIATSTGGLVDTIQDNFDGFRTKAFFDQVGWENKGQIYGESKEFSTNQEAFCEAMERGLNTFYHDKGKFKDMQQTAISRDFSWKKPGGALDKYINLIKTGKTE